jgi:hypothetical protein
VAALGMLSAHRPHRGCESRPEPVAGPARRRGRAHPPGEPAAGHCVPWCRLAWCRLAWCGLRGGCLPGRAPRRVLVRFASCGIGSRGIGFSWAGFSGAGSRRRHPDGSPLRCGRPGAGSAAAVARDGDPDRSRRAPCRRCRCRRPLLGPRAGRDLRRHGPQPALPGRRRGVPGCRPGHGDQRAPYRDRRLVPAEIAHPLPGGRNAAKGWVTTRVRAANR